MVSRVCRWPCTIYRTGRGRGTAIRPRRYATVGSTTFIGNPPKPPNQPAPSLPAPSELDNVILSELRKSETSASLPALVQQYSARAGHVLSRSLPYDPRPDETRKPNFDAEDTGVVLIAHAIAHGTKHKVSLCSGFTLEAPVGSESQGYATIVTCTHTFEEIQNSSLFSSVASSIGGASPEGNPSMNSTTSGSSSFVISAISENPDFHPVSSVLSSLPRADVMMLSAPVGVGSPLRALPISPYPAAPGTPIRAHFITDKEPEDDGWSPWVGGMWRKWARGKVLGYRDFAGREAQPGTYDALTHMMFEPLPTHGSSGGPIVDEDSGAVVGVVRGARMDSRIEGMRGWAIPSEAIFEMFSLPGLRS